MMLSRLPALVMRKESRQFPALLRRTYISVDDMIFGEPTIPGNQANSTAQSKLLAPYPVSKKINGKFVGPWPNTRKGLWDVLGLLFGKKRPQLNFSKAVNQLELLQPIPVDRQKMRSVASPHFSWFGHASCYYQSDDIFFLTDPVWSDRASPITIAGPKRFVKPPIELEDLKIDVVLLSHTHYDHLDAASAKRIGNRAHWIVPLGVKEIMKSFGVTNVTELDWWQSYHHITPTGKTAEIIFTPTKHWTSRSLFDRNTCLWGSYVVKTAKSKFFFTGDTAYDEVFKLIGEKYGPFDISAIPIGAYSPRWFMKDVHCDPVEAVQIHEDLKSKQSAAIHWGTFPMTDEDKVEPALELARARDLKKLPASSFFTMAQGETLSVGEEPQHDFGTKHLDLYGEYLTLRRNIELEAV